MKTITFYSYKGGVGRTLALSNIATRLSELGKKVCLLDFDLEAPGLPFKFRNNKKEIKSGIVDYIYKFSCNGIIPDNIKDYSISLDALNSNFRPIDLIPAGNIEDNGYWKKLSMINWSEMFYSENGQGVKFILDLKAKIEKELAPDILLVDSRTGITDIAGITLKLLADEVVILASFNDENLFGSKKIIKSLLDNSNSLFGKTPKINFILTRLPFSGESADNIKENILINKVEKEFKESLGLSDFDISIIHSDRRLEENERQLIGYEYEEKTVSISNDYLKLFDKLTSDILSENEISLFKNKKIAEKEYNKALFEKDFTKQLQYLNKAIDLDNTKWEYFFRRGYLFENINEHTKSNEDYMTSLKLNPNNVDIYNNIGINYYKLNKKNEAIKYFNKAIKMNPKNILGFNNLAFLLKNNNEFDKALTILNKAIEVDNSNDQILNTRADLYRALGDMKNAYADIYKAIEINSKDGIYFGTLAEIFASEGKIEEFYFNLNIALGMGLTASQINTTKDVYEKFRNEERFIDLMAKHNIDIDDIFKEGN